MHYFFIIAKFITSNKVTKLFVSFRGDNRGFLKISLSLDSICQICQFLLILCQFLCFRSGRVLLKVTIKGIFLSFSVGFLIKVSFLGIAITLLLMWGWFQFCHNLYQLVSSVIFGRFFQIALVVDLLQICRFLVVNLFYIRIQEVSQQDSNPHHWIPFRRFI